HLVDVARGELAAGLDVHVVASTLREPAFEQDLRGLERAGAVVERLPMLRAHLLRTQPDVLHTHSSKAGVLGRLASVQTGVGARVHTPHTFAFLFEAEFGPRKRALFRSIERGLS